MFVSNATMLLKLKAWVIVIINKEDKSCFIVDIAIPGDARRSEKKGERLQNTKTWREKPWECVIWKVLR